MARSPTLNVSPSSYNILSSLADIPLSQSGRFDNESQRYVNEKEINWNGLTIPKTHI